MSRLAKPKWTRLQFGFTTLFVICVAVAIGAWLYGDRSPNRKVNVCVRVVDQLSGKPVTKFRYRYSIESRHVTSGKRYGDWIEVESDDGAVILTSPASCLFRFEADAMGYVSTFGKHEREFLLDANDGNYRELELRMDPGVTVTGQVFDIETGKSVEGVRVSPAYFMRNLGTVANDTRSVETDAEGRFTCSGISHSDGFFLTHDQYYEKHIRTSNVTHKSLGRVGIKPGKFYRGVVTDETAKPIEGVSIFYGRVTSNNKVQTDANGLFTLVAPPENGDGKVRLRIYKPGFIDQVQRVAVSESSDIRLTMKRSIAFAATVVDPNGVPVTEYKAVAMLLGSDSPRDRYSQSVFSEQSELQFNCQVEGKYWLAILADGYAMWKEDIEMRPGMSPLKIQLERGLTLKGKLRFPQAPYSQIKAKLAYVNVDKNKVSSFGDYELLELSKREVDVDGDGEFVFQNIRPDFYRLSIHGKGISPARKVIEVSADKSTVELEIQGTGVLRGTVFKISEPGVPWPFAKGFINHHGQSMQFIADEEGNYELKDAPVGKINVSFINPNDRSWPVRPESKAVDVEAGKVTSVNFFEK